MALPKDPFLYKLIIKAIEQFSDTHNVTGRAHFANLLGFKGENAHVQLSSYLNYTSYVPTNPKPISIDHFKVLLDELGEDRNIILDALLKEYGLIAVKEVKNTTDIADINLLVDKANIENSDVFRVVKAALENGSIEEDEKESILKEIEEAQRANAQLKDMVLHIATKE